MSEVEEKCRILRQVGNTTLYLPQLGIGCSALGELWDKVNITDAVATLGTAADTHGIAYFDTAPWYGNGCSETRVGVAINDILSRKSIKVKVSTKVGKLLDPLPKENEVGPWIGGYDLRILPDYSYDGIIQQHRESCLRLGVAFVDALVIHDLDIDYLTEDTENHLNQLVDRNVGGLKALFDLKKSGKIKAVGIGCNVFEFKCLEVCKRVFEAAKELEIIDGSSFKALDYVLCAGEFNLLSQKSFDELIPMCGKYDLSLVIGAPYGGNGAILARGVKHNNTAKENLEFMYAPAPNEIVEKVLAIEDICDRYGVSLGAAALQFPLLHPFVKCVLVGVKSKEEVSFAVKYMNEDIPITFWEELKSKKLIREITIV